MSTPSNDDRAAGRLLQPVAAAQQRALARARRPDDEHELPRRDGKVDAASAPRSRRSSCRRPRDRRGSAMPARDRSQPSVRDVRRLSRTSAARGAGRSPACRARRTRERSSPPPSRARASMPNHFSCIDAMVPSIFMHSMAFSTWLAQLVGILAQRRGPHQAGRIQIGQFAAADCCFTAHAIDRVAGDVGVGAAGQHRLHGVGLRAEALDLPADLGLEPARPAVVGRALVDRDDLALELLRASVIVGSPFLVRNWKSVLR